MWLKRERRILAVPEDQPIRSFRGWQPHCDGCWHGRQHDHHEELLVSIYVGTPWLPGDQKARVIGSMYWVGDPIVALHTTAGIYGMKTLKRLVERVNDHEARTMVCARDLLYGSVLHWGTVVEHEDGYRSEFARIERVYVPRGWPNERIKNLAARYEIPVQVRTVAA